MLEKSFIIKNPEIVKKDLIKRGDTEKIKWVDELIVLDKEWKKLKRELDNLRSDKNKVSLEINRLKKEKKDASQQIKRASELPKKISEKENDIIKIEEKMKYYLMRIPNILHDSVPVGKNEDDNQVIKIFGKKPIFNFELKSHVELIEKNNWADLERAAKISGARWYFLKGELALLEMAITRYAIDFMMKKGYSFVVPPYMMCKKAYEGVTSLADFEDMLYKIEGEDLYMIATSEHPLTAMWMGEVLEEKSLPIKMAGYSTNFRKEAGAHGKDTKGIFRVHQFNKIEQIIICKQEDSWKFHEELRKNIEEFFESLGIHFRTVNICTGDIGVVAAKKYDIEAWMPVQNKFREMGSCSNCTSYQSVRLNIKYRTKDGNKYVHTLNSTCVATSRALVAIIENFQNKDGSVNIPEVLVPYMNGKRTIR
ncbi:MAG: serine--tRNA ligase [Candidatus Woesearchaeota archaeon]